MFEAVRQAVLEAIEKGRDTPRCPIDNLRPEVRAALRSVVGGFVESKGEFSAMLDDMIGSPSSQSRDVSDGSHANQGRWSEALPSNSDTVHELAHAALDNDDAFPQEAATYVFSLDNMAMDDLTMDFSVPEDMDMLIGGLVDVSQNEWVMRNTFTPTR